MREPFYKKVLSRRYPPSMRLGEEVIRPVCYVVKRFFEFFADVFHLFGAGVSADVERTTADEHPSREGIRHHEGVPARKGFFFDAEKVTGIMGSPVAFASCTAPIWALRAGPLGPSGVMARSFPLRADSRSPLTPSIHPRVVEPRTEAIPKRFTVLAIS